MVRVEWVCGRRLWHQNTQTPDPDDAVGQSKAGSGTNGASTENRRECERARETAVARRETNVFRERGSQQRNAKRKLAGSAAVASERGDVVGVKRKLGRVEQSFGT